MTSDQERAAPAQQPVAWRFIYQLQSGGWARGFSVSKPSTGLEVEPLYIAPSSEPELRAKIVSLQAEVERLTADRATVARIWKSLGIKTYEEAGGREISEIVADLTSRVEALLAEVGTARAAAFEEAAQIVERCAQETEIFKVQKHLRRVAAAIRSRTALDKGATT